MALTGLFCVGFVLTLHPKYGSGDDPTMALIAAGLHGNPPSEFLIYMNVLWGLALKTLYTHFGAVNWHGLAEYAVQALSLGGLFFAILWRGSTLRGLLCCLGVTTLALPYWMSLHFTTVAIWAAWSGAWLFLASREAPPRVARGMLGLGVVLLVVASLVRLPAAIVGLVMMAPWLLDAVLPRPPRRLVVAALLALGLAGLAAAGDAHYYRARPAWRDWLVYNRARAELHDRLLVRSPGPVTHDGFEAAGWSRLNEQLFRRGTFFDAHLYDREHLEAVASKLENQFQPLWFIRGMLELRLAKSSAMPRLAVPILLYLCLGRRRLAYLGRAGASLVLLYGFALWLLQSYKLDVRVLQPMIDVVPLASLLWLAAPADPAGPEGRRRHRVVEAIGMVAALIYAAQGWASVEQQLAASEANARRAEQGKRALETLARPPDQHNRRPFFVTLGRSIPIDWLNPLEGIAVLRDAPILRLGWLTHSPHYRAMLKHRRVRDLYTALVVRPDVLVVSDWISAYLLAHFLREHRLREVRVEHVPGFEEFESTFPGSRVYRLRQTPRRFPEPVAPSPEAADPPLEAD